LRFLKCQNFDEALEVANNTEYGLTGAVITNNRKHINGRNRNSMSETCTSTAIVQGAIVGYHPFGGFKMSGTDSKAGGPDYLALTCRRKQSVKCFKRD
jgi:1-pyrroline-5-carboxylate dehydrogenase